MQRSLGDTFQFGARRATAGLDSHTAGHRRQILRQLFRALISGQVTGGDHRTETVGELRLTGRAAVGAKSDDILMRGVSRQAALDEKKA